MQFIIDLIVIGIIFLSTFLGYRKGLIGVAFKIASFIIAIIITLILFKPISNFIINNTEFAQTIENTIVQKLSTAEIENGQIKQENSNLPEVIVNYINVGLQNTVNEAKDSIVKIVARNLAETIIDIIVIIGLFIITRLLLLFAKAILEAISEIPIIKQFNKAGGILYGILRGLLLIYLTLAIISLLLPMLDKTAILNIINNSILTKILYNNNIILMIFF
mgnify:FL=1